MNQRGWLLSLMVCVLLACEDTEPEASLVDELRLLAVQSDRPFALPGDEVRLRGLAHDPEQRALSWGFGVCVDPSTSLAVECLRKLAFESLTLTGDVAEHVLRVPALGSSYVGVAVVVCPGSIVPGSTAGLPLSCVDSMGRALALSEFEVGLKRIFLEPAERNQNPIAGELLWDGVAWPEGEVKVAGCAEDRASGCSDFRSHTVELRAALAAEPVLAEGPQRTEQAIVQFYATGGEFDDDLRSYERGQNRWRARRDDAGKVLTLWVVLRDNRGGVTWVTRQLMVP